MRNLFGTDGIRSRVGTPPLTYLDVPRIGYAVGKWALKRYGTPLRIILAQDSRQSGEWMSIALATGLMVHPIAISYAHTLPTPAICNLLRQGTDFDLGIMISASHNVYHDNGIKIIDRTTGKISLKDEEIISELFYTQKMPSYASFGTFTSYPLASSLYIALISQLFSANLLAHTKIILDCANGATSAYAPTIFENIGAQVIALNTKPNGTNINEQCGALHVQHLAHTMHIHNAALGFAFDGDGDRVMIMTKDGTIRDGDDMLALLSLHQAYRAEQTIVGTIMSNHGLDLYLKENHKQLIRTPVGDKYIADYLQQHHLALGGEQSGHIILNDCFPTADCIVTALRIVEAIIQTDTWDFTTFTHYPQMLVNVPIRHKKNLEDPAIAAIIADYELQLHTGRLVVRYSGTENVLRIMVEDRELQTAQRVSNALAHTLQKELL